MLFPQQRSNSRYKAKCPANIKIHDQVESDLISLHRRIEDRKDELLTPARVPQSGRLFLGDELQKMSETESETSSTSSQRSETVMMVPEIPTTKMSLHKLETNWGKRNSSKYLNKIEKLKENRVDPSHLKIKKPNNKLIVDSIREGLEREQKKKKDVHTREKEYEKELEEKALKKKVSVPVMLFRRYGLQHPDDDKSENMKHKIEKVKKRMVKKREKFMTLCRKDTPKSYSTEKYKVKNMEDYIEKKLFTTLKHRLRGPDSKLKIKSLKFQYLGKKDQGCMTQRNKDRSIFNNNMKRLKSFGKQTMKVTSANDTRAGTPLTTTKRRFSNRPKTGVSRRMIYSQRSNRRGRPVSSFKSSTGDHVISVTRAGSRKEVRKL